jgi:two-component system LytT family response regulator
MNKPDKIQALIVDDELSGREQIQHHLLKHNSIIITGIVASVDEALSFIRKKMPDVIFLDIDMPGKNGFDLVDELKTRDIQVEIVFVTAFDKYAIQAIKASAFDYILKPIDKEELNEVIKKLINKSHQAKDKYDFSQLFSRYIKPQKLRFNQKGRTIFINPADIIYCHADGNYTQIFLGENESETISHHLKEVQQLLGENFQRIGRSTIFNKDYLVKIDKQNKKLELRKNSHCINIPVSSRRLNQI